MRKLPCITRQDQCNHKRPYRCEAEGQRGDALSLFLKMGQGDRSQRRWVAPEDERSKQTMPFWSLWKEEALPPSRTMRQQFGVSSSWVVACLCFNSKLMYSSCNCLFVFYYIVLETINSSRMGSIDQSDGRTHWVPAPRICTWRFLICLSV